MPDTNGSTNRSATSGPNRRAKNARTDSFDGSPRRTKGSRRKRSFPRADRSFVARSAAGDIGRAFRRPPKSTYLARRASARRTSPPRPSSSTSTKSSGVGRTVLGPSSRRYPSRRSVRTTPPARSDASNTTTSSPRAARARARTRPDRPAPTTAVVSVSTPEGRVRRRDFGEGPQKRGAVVQPRRAAEVRDPDALRLVGEELVDLVKGLDVVAHEGDRDHEHLGGAFAGELADRSERGRPEPLDRPELRLVGERRRRPSAERGVDRCHGRFDFARIRVALLRHELPRDRVRGVEEVHAFRPRVGETSHLLADRLGMSFDETGMRRPGSELVELAARGELLHGRARAFESTLGRGERVVGVEGESEKAFHPLRCEVGD